MTGSTNPEYNIMRKLLIIILALSMGITACTTGGSGEDKLFEKANLVAWCIVPFDSENRTPQERAEMLDDLDLKHFAYDYRDEHIPSFKLEIETLRDHHIELSAVWLWVDPRWEEPLNTAGREVFDILRETGTQTEIWVGFPDNAFEGKADDKCLTMAVEVVREVLQEAEDIGCTLALYNHGGWFGEPVNLIRIVESVGSEKIRIVYNFHHAHHQVDQFEALLQKMLPYLSTININGMKVEGPKIITLGEGDRELEMLGIIRASGYSGPIGIIGHTEGEDIRLVLERNLKGLERMKLNNSSPIRRCQKCPVAAWGRPADGAPSHTSPAIPSACEAHRSVQPVSCFRALHPGTAPA